MKKAILLILGVLFLFGMALGAANILAFKYLSPWTGSECHKYRKPYWRMECTVDGNHQLKDMILPPTFTGLITEFYWMKQTEAQIAAYTFFYDNVQLTPNKFEYW